MTVEERPGFTLRLVRGDLGVTASRTVSRSLFFGYSAPDVIWDASRAKVSCELYFTIFIAGDDNYDGWCARVRFAGKSGETTDAML